MKKIKLHTVIGARPQFIKASVVSRAFQNKYPEKIEETLIHTGQHYDQMMSKVFFEEMGIPKPKVNLGISEKTHATMVGKMLEGIGKVLIEEKPTALMVYGDTNSTLAGALAASKLHIPVIHVEAGLRSFNKDMPEEINRILTDHMSSLLFSPSEHASVHLKNENIDSDCCHLVGDVMYDSALYFKEKGRPTESLNELREKLDNHYGLCTLHRAENTDDPNRLRDLVEALDSFSKEIPVILPLHPRTEKKLKEADLSFKNVHLMDPVGYIDMIHLISNSCGVFTDSGGLQKEAYFFDKKCIVLRNETEWTELVDCGAAKLLNSNYSLISDAKAFFEDKNDVFSKKLYGDGTASIKIADKIVEYFS